MTLNLPQIGIIARNNEELFWKLLDERLEICFEALMCRHRALRNVTSDISPIHWQHGAIARLQPGEKITPLLENGYSTLSLGYIGVYEMTLMVKGVSHTTDEGKDFALRVMTYLRDTCVKWKKETGGLGFALYGSPSEATCYRLCKIDEEKFGKIDQVTEKGWYTNSYHISVEEEIDAFSKFKTEAQFQDLSLGGAISYVEIPNMSNNLDALESVVKFIYDNIQYGEFNTKSDYCLECGYDGEIKLNDKLEWQCPNCGNKDHAKLEITRRVCGYLGANFFNVGKTKEIAKRVLHL